MNIRIRTEHAGEIKLSPVLPAALKQLQIPESICYSASGSFGHILLQQLEGESISVLYHTFYFTNDDQLTYSSHESSIRLQIILRNSYFYKSKPLGAGALHERGINLNYVPSIHTVFGLRKQETYSHVAIYYTKEHLLSLSTSFPSLKAFLEQVDADKAMQFNERYSIADAPILSLIDSMLDCNYKGPLRKVVLESLAVEILLMSLLKITQATSRAVIPVGEAESVHIYQAKELILQDMGKSFSMPALAKQTGLSIYKLNNGFKGIYGMGVTEFLLEARMAKAHQVLMETDTPVSVVAENSGYSHHHAFEHAFKKYFGYTPAFVQRSGKKSS
ncbi:MAG TPA: AraC family transcriptional regulator [Puia sp.]